MSDFDNELDLQESRMRMLAIQARDNPEVARLINVACLNARSKGINSAFQAFRQDIVTEMLQQNKSINRQDAEFFASIAIGEFDYRLKRISKFIRSAFPNMRQMVWENEIEENLRKEANVNRAASDFLFEKLEKVKDGVDSDSVVCIEFIERAKNAAFLKSKSMQRREEAFLKRLEREDEEAELSALRDSREELSAEEGKSTDEKKPLGWFGLLGRAVTAKDVSVPTLETLLKKWEGYKSLNEWQLEIIECMKSCFLCTSQELKTDEYDYRRLMIAIAGAYGVGKTYALCVATIMFLYIHGVENRDNTAKGTIVSGSQGQLRTVICAEMLRTLKESPFSEYIVCTRTMVKCKNNEDVFVRLMVCNERNPDSFSGMHAARFFCAFDEGTAIPDEAYKLAYNASTPPVGTKNNENNRFFWVVTGNPTTTGCAFHKLFEDERWLHKHVSRLDVNGETDEYSHSIKRVYGADSDEYRVAVLGMFPKFGNRNVFPKMLIDEAVARYNDLKHMEPVSYYVGVDIGGGVGQCDSTCVVRDEHCIRAIYVANIGSFEVPEWIERILRQYDNIVTVGVDGLGVGLGVHSVIRRQLHSSRTSLRYRMPAVIPIISSAAPNYNLGAFNLRAELIAEARFWLNTGAIMSDSVHTARLKDELSTVVLEEGTNKFKIEKKAEKLDIADAFIYTFARTAETNG